MKEFSEIRATVKEMNISDENDLTFKAACIILYGIEIDSWNIKRISWASGYIRSEVQKVLDNLRNNRIISYLDTTLDLGCEEGEEWMGFILACMAGSGEIVRHTVDNKSAFAPSEKQKAKEVQEIPSKQSPVLSIGKFIKIKINNEINWVKFISINDKIITGAIESVVSRFYEKGEIVKFSVTDIVQIQGRSKKQLAEIKNKLTA